jgi:5-methylcytosine-specific restriction endonuclease McrA
MPPRTVFDRLWEKQGGKDAITGIPFAANDKVVRDHILPLIDGGANRENNLQLITIETHATKTADEATRRGKERSVRAKARGYVTTDRRSSFQSRGFPPAKPRKTATTPPTKRVGQFEEETQ